MRISLSTLVALGVLATTCDCAAQAQTPAKNRQASRITIHNAHQVKLLATIDKRAKRVYLGPGRNEVTLELGNRSVLIVDDQNFHLKRKVEGRQRKRFRPSTIPGVSSWLDRKFTVQFADGTKKQFPRGETPHSPVLSPDQELVVIGDAITTGHEGEGYSRARVYAVKTGKLVYDLDAGSAGWSALTPTFSPNGKLLAVGSRNYQTRLFDVATGKLIRTFPKRMTHGIAFSPDGKSIAACYVDGSLVIWDVASGRMLRSTKTDCDDLYRVDWNEQGDLLVTGGLGGSVTLWNPSTLGRVRKLIPMHWASEVWFTRDGTRLLASGKADKGGPYGLYVWSVDAAAPKAEPPAARR